MCKFFSCLVTRDGDVRFCEDDSHEKIIKRLGWPDDRPLETRGWVRAECVPPHTSVRVDETSVPGWYAEDRARFDGLVTEMAQRVAPFYAGYEAKRAPLDADYEAKVADLDADYKAKVADLEADYAGRLSILTGYVPSLVTA